MGQMFKPVKGSALKRGCLNAAIRRYDAFTGGAGP